MGGARCWPALQTAVARCSMVVLRGKREPRRQRGWPVQGFKALKPRAARTGVACSVAIARSCLNCTAGLRLSMFLGLPAAGNAGGAWGPTAGLCAAALARSVTRCGVGLWEGDVGQCEGAMHTVGCMVNCMLLRRACALCRCKGWPARLCGEMHCAHAQSYEGLALAARHLHWGWGYPWGSPIAWRP